MIIKPSDIKNVNICILSFAGRANDLEYVRECWKDYNEWKQISYWAIAYYKALKSRRQWNGHKLMEQYKEHRSVSYKFAHLCFYKGVKLIEWRKISLFNKRWEFTWTAIGLRKKNLDLDYVPYINMSSQWIMDLNVQC